MKRQRTDLNTLIYGCPTTGKTIVKRVLQRRLDRLVIDTDDLIYAYCKDMLAGILGSSGFNQRDVWNYWRQMSMQLSGARLRNRIKRVVLSMLRGYEQVDIVTNLTELRRFADFIFLRPKEDLFYHFKKREEEKATANLSTSELVAKFPWLDKDLVADFYARDNLHLTPHQNATHVHILKREEYMSSCGQLCSWYGIDLFRVALDQE